MMILWFIVAFPLFVSSFRLESIIQFPISDDASSQEFFYHLSVKPNSPSKPVILWESTKGSDLDEKSLYTKDFITAASRMCLSSYSPPKAPISMTIKTLKLLQDGEWDGDEILSEKDGYLDSFGQIMQVHENDEDEKAKYERDDSFGWNSSALRGHIFASKDKSLVIIAIKGTSIPYSDDQETVANDKYNDNMMFSCCCARMAYSFSTICNCPQKFGQCNSSCLADSLKNPLKPSYYQMAKIMFQYVRSIYPKETTRIWLTGHSLGGALAALTALTFDTIAVTFEAPGEALYARRIGLKPSKASLEKIYHVGNDLDPIFLGTCNGVLSSCYLGGYAMESKCHLGNVCTFKIQIDDGKRQEPPSDPYLSLATIAKKGKVYRPPVLSLLASSASIEYHRLQVVINKILEQYESLPICQSQESCIDCSQWDFK